MTNFTGRAFEWFEGHGIGIERLMTDNHFSDIKSASRAELADGRRARSPGGRGGVRATTVAIAVAHYRTTDEERAARQMLEVVAPHLATSADERTRRLEEAKVKESLGKSRLAYQGGLTSGSVAAPALPSGED